MVPATPESRFQLYYWPIPFRGCFVSYLFAYQDVLLIKVENIAEIEDMMSRETDEQLIPFMGPPVLRDLETGRTLSQMPAIALYVAHELRLLPEDQFDVALCMKVIMDCNDLLMEVCRYNGSSMWVRKEWVEFRSRRFPRWLQIFEESMQRGFIGKGSVSFADVGVYALFGNMIRCLPELEADIVAHAPRVRALCRTIGAQPSLAEHVKEEERKYGKLYCGGQIEESIRTMLSLDAQQP